MQLNPRRERGREQKLVVQLLLRKRGGQSPAVQLPLKGSESSEGSKLFYLDFFFSSFRGNRNIISGDQQRRTMRSLYGFYSSKVDRFEMKNINSRFEEFLKMYQCLPTSHKDYE